MADALNPDALHTDLNQLDGWEGSTEKIMKSYSFADFAEAMRFVNRVAEIAERLNHHPDIAISWDTVELSITSHAEGGVTEDCIELARAIDAEPDAEAV